MSWTKQLKSAIAHLNPNEARQDSERPLRIGLQAATELSYFHMESFLAPDNLSAGRRIEVERVLGRVAPELGAVPAKPHPYDIEIHSEGAGSPAGSFLFSFSRPEDTVRQILDAKPDFALALARNVAPFRRPAIGRIVHTVARENALF